MSIKWVSETSNSNSYQVKSSQLIAQKLETHNLIKSALKFKNHVHKKRTSITHLHPVQKPRHQNFGMILHPNIIKNK